MRTRLTLALSLVLFLIAPPLSANVTGSAITGRVVVADAPAPGVTVTASSSVLQHPRTTITGPNGTYWLGALPPGEYELTFTLKGHNTLIRRIVTELADVARADATLEENVDEDTVTSTATTVSVADTTAITTHFDDAFLDRLPLGRRGNVQVAPDPSFPAYAETDGTPAFLSFVDLAEDVVEQTTVVRGGAPVELESYGGKVTSTLTRRGREGFSFSLRDTLTSNAWIEGDQRTFPDTGDEDGSVEHLLEATGGGRILSQRLWFFAGAWGGDRAPYTGDIVGFTAKLDAQLGGANHFTAAYLESESTPSVLELRSSAAWLHHTAVSGPHLTVETQLARSWSNISPLQLPYPTSTLHSDFLHSRASYLIPTRRGDHLLTAGTTLTSGSFDSDSDSFFLGDRWSSSRWVVNGGLRYDREHGDDRVTPRVGVSYDVRGDGRRAIVASYGDYALGRVAIPSLRVATLGYSTAIGRTGMLRVDALRRWQSSVATNSVQLETRYRLFGRLETGATYTYDRIEDDGGFRSSLPDHTANAWFGVEVPLGEHELGVTILQRYLSMVNPPFYDEDVLPTDVALRYSIPFQRVRLMVATDVENVLGHGDQTVTVPRALRFWLRLRV